MFRTINRRIIPIRATGGNKMRTLLGITAAAAMLACVSNPAQAATDTRYQTAQGGVVCKPSDMVSNSYLKAKATGLRNEGTASAFVICGFESSNSRADFGTIQGITMGLYSLNGVAASVSCTAVNGFSDSSPIYATKAISTNANGTGALLKFDASDFGGVAGDVFPKSDFWSVTCSLPGKSSIGYMVTQFTVNVPN
jgi:hypothetical protein